MLLFPPPMTLQIISSFTRLFILFFFFFFQAEDGIRDYKVTGVQTCALPICARPDGDWYLTATVPGGVVGAGFQRQILASPNPNLPLLTDEPGTSAEDGAGWKIGRASCRERGEVWGGGREFKKKERRNGGRTK